MVDSDERWKHDLEEEVGVRLLDFVWLQGYYVVSHIATHRTSMLFRGGLSVEKDGSMNAE